MKQGFSLEFSLEHQEQWLLTRSYGSQVFSMDFDQVCLPGQPLCANALIFIKDKRLLEKFLLSLKDPSISRDRLVLIADSSLQPSLEKVAAAADLEVFYSEQFDLTMCMLSKVIYDQRVGCDHSLVDGRITGDVHISPLSKIAQNTFIGQSVCIGEHTTIYPGVTIMDGAEIGSYCQIYPGVIIYPQCQVGERCRIHGGTIIGADGFGYHYQQGEHHKIWQSGGVIIEDDVEIGANSCVDSGAFIPTRIGRGSKVDNQVQIGHNSQVGKGVILCGQVGLAGSCSIADFSVMGGRAGIGPDCHIGQGCQVAGGAMINKSWGAGSKLAGHPATELKDWVSGHTIMRSLIKEKKKSQ